MTEIHEALRRWANGLYPLEAGVDLLIRSRDGRQPGAAVGPAQRRPRPVVDRRRTATEDNYGVLSGGETRLLRIAALLGRPPVDLSENLAGLDREHIQLVLAAIVRASGGHACAGSPSWTAKRTAPRPQWHQG
jgi:hypothetical protein